MASYQPNLVYWEGRQVYSAIHIWIAFSHAALFIISQPIDKGTDNGSVTESQHTTFKGVHPLCLGWNNVLDYKSHVLHCLTGRPLYINGPALCCVACVHSKHLWNFSHGSGLQLQWSLSIALWATLTCLDLLRTWKRLGFAMPSQTSKRSELHQWPEGEGNSLQS